MMTSKMIAKEMGVTVRAINSRAAAENWAFQPRSGRGGGKIFPFSALPQDVKDALIAAEKTKLKDTIISALPPTSPALPSFAEVSTAYVGSSQKQASVALERYRIIEPLLSLPRESKGRRERAKTLAAAHGISPATLYRWEAAYKKGGMTALMSKRRADNGRSRVFIGKKWDEAAIGAGLSEEAAEKISGLLRLAVRGLWGQGDVSSRQVANLAAPILYRLSVEAGVIPSLAQLLSKVPRRFVEAEKRYKRIAVYDRQAKKFYDQHQTAIYRSRESFEPGDLVFGDVSPADIPVLRADGKLAWARLIVWQDAATNMIYVTGYLPEKGMGVRREHIALSFASMCANSPWGMPKQLYLDNGSEYNWTEMLTVWKDLTLLTGGAFSGIQVGGEEGRVYRSKPFHPRAKNLEGIFSTLAHYLSWHPLYAGGNRMVQRTRCLGKKPEAAPLEDLKTFFSEAIPYYHAVQQGGTHMQNRSPIQVLNEFVARGWKKITVDEEALMLAFSDREERKIIAGTVNVGGWRYYHEKLHLYDGEVLPVRFPRHNPVCAYVFRENKLLCVAKPMPVFAHTDPEGAKYAHKLAINARKSVVVMKGQVSWLDPRDLMKEFARLAGVREAIAATDENAGRISVADAEVQQLYKSRHKLAQEVLSLSEKSTDLEKLKANRFGIEEDPELRALKLAGWE